MKTKQIMSLVVFLCVSFAFCACHDDEDNMPDVQPTALGTLVDRDGNEYHWVRIGCLDWMTENLRCDDPFYEDIYNPKWTGKFDWGLGLDGDTEDWKNWYDNFGNYYSWQEAVDNAPEGWRLPTDEDFKALERQLGMKASDLDMEGWRAGASALMSQNETGTKLHFTYGGAVGPSLNTAGIVLSHQYDYGYYWTATDTVVNHEAAAFARKITPGMNAVNRIIILQENRCLSVRYVRDAK